MVKVAKKEKTTKKSVKSVKKVEKVKKTEDKRGSRGVKEVQKQTKPVETLKPSKLSKPSNSIKSEEDEKQDVIKQFATQANDTGSPEVQVAILTWKIVRLQKHLAENPKDNHSRRGLLKIISKRRRIMNYLKKKEGKRYTELEAKIQDYQKRG